MTAEIISVGTELLMGETINTNAAFLGRELASLGISVYSQNVVGDNVERLINAYANAYAKGADLVIATGGLGPTEDDITKEAAAEYFGLPLVFHEPSWEVIQSLFKKTHPDQDITPNNKKQAMVPGGCHIFPNGNGAAPGIFISHEKGKMILLPGPPSELEPMFLEHAAPFLRENSQAVLVSKVIKVTSIGESVLEHRIKDLIESQSNPTIAPYAKSSEVWLRITASAKQEKEAQALIEPVSAKLYEILGNAIYGKDEDTLEGVITDLLLSKKLKLVCAESCTGGMIASKMVNHPGVSDVFQGGIVAYANEAKINWLNVDKEILENHGAVSPETAAAMAEGAVKSASATVGLSTTGIAGPDGGTEDKPVGLVYVGLYLPGMGTRTKKLMLNGNRAKIRARATIAALDFLRLALLGI